MSDLKWIVQKQYEIVSAYQNVALDMKDRDAANALAVVIDKLATLREMDHLPIDGRR